jgi:hypothetical protein
MYAGIAVAPLLGAAALGTGAPAAVPLIGAGLTVLGLVAFLVGFRLRRGERTAMQEAAAVELAEEEEGEPVRPTTEPVTLEA